MTLYAGAADPESLRVTVTGPVTLDLTAVVGAEATVIKPGGSTATWDFVLGAATATSLVLTRVFDAGGGDVASGVHRLLLRLDFGGGVVRRTAPVSFTVTAYS